MPSRDQVATGLIFTTDPNPRRRCWAGSRAHLRGKSGSLMRRRFSVWWHEQSWPGIEKIDKTLPVIVPLGSIEQHGKHLPLCVDTVQVTAVAERAEKPLGDKAIFLPPLWLGSSDHHKDFP